MQYKTSSHHLKAALSILLALVLAVTAVSVGFVMPSSTLAASSAKTYADGIDDELGKLKDNIEEYEGMMDGEHLYTNMEAAYEKYCDACKTYYENYYGYDYEDGAKVHTQSVNEVTSANTALETAIENMKPYTGYVGEATTAADGDYTKDEDVAKANSSTALLMQKDDSNTYTVDCSTQYGTSKDTEAKVMGDDHNSIEMYDELSGVMYTYGVSNQNGANAGNYGPSPTATKSNGGRLGSAEVNVGLIYGSVVFLYTGEGKEENEYFKRTSTYAVPINAYVDCAQDYKDQISVSYIGVNLEDEEYDMNGGAFELHRGWHGWLEYQNHTSYYVTGTGHDDNNSNNNYATSSNNYENHFFGYTEGFGYYSQSSYYSEICANGATGNEETGSGLYYRSHTPDHSGNTNWYNTIYSNTLYYTGDPKTSVANKDTTKIAGESTSSVTGTGTYYAAYDLLDYTYYNMSGGNSGTGNQNRKRSGCFGNYWLIRPVRSGTSGSVTGYYSNHAGNNGSGNITNTTLPNFVKAVEDFETSGDASGFYSSTTENNSFASNAQPGGAADSYIYVVDYEPVLDAVDEYMQYTKIADPDSNTYYRYGSDSMKAILSAFDSITGYNPNSAFSGDNNITTLNVAETVEDVAETLEDSVDSLEDVIEDNTIAASEATPKSATQPLADTDEDLIVKDYDTVSYTIHEMVQTGYDEATGTSNKYDFLTSEGQFVTTGTDDMGVYEYYDGTKRPEPKAMSSTSPTSVKPLVSSNYEYTTIKGTVGETRATYTVSISRADDDLLMGHEFNSEVFASYYGATEGAQDTLTGGFLNDVFTSVTEYAHSSGYQPVDYTATITVYAQKAELYVFESAREYQIYYILKDRTNYDTEGDAAYKTSVVLEQRDPITISYYTKYVEDAVPTTFVHNGALYKLSTATRDVWSGNGNPSVSRADTSKGDVTYTWLYTEAYHTSAREVNVYYTRVPVNVVYASHSVIIESGTNQIIGDATQTDGYVKVKGAEDSTATEQFSEQTTAAYNTYVDSSTTYPVSGPVGATAVPNTSTDNGKEATFVRWYLLDKAPGDVTWYDFSSATAVSGSWTETDYVPNLVDDMKQAGLAAANATEEDIIGAWDEETTYYYYAVFTADEPDTSTKHLQVTLQIDDWDPSMATETGTQFIVNVTDEISDGLDMDISYVAEIGSDGTVTLTFDLLPGTCVVEINTDFAYGYSLVIDEEDTHNLGDGTQQEIINTGTEDNHHLYFHLVYDPLNTAESNSDSKTNNFTYGTTTAEDPTPD